VRESRLTDSRIKPLHISRILGIKLNYYAKQHASS
jgi:hypothetical protein